MNSTLRWAVDDQPSRGFPVYTRGNAGEVLPNVMTPMTGSLIGAASKDGQIRAMRELGVVTARDLTEPGAVGTGVFGGYLYGNFSLMRVACDRAPGMTALDADRQAAGLSSDAPPHRRQPGDRNPAASLRGIRVMGRNMLWPDISEIDSARAATDRWRSSVAAPEGMSDQQLVEFVGSYPPRVADGVRQLLLYSGFAAAGGAMMERFTERAGSPAGTATSLTSGLGTIDSAAPAFRLWTLGRQVAASPTLMQFFDDENADLTEIAGHPDVEDFQTAFTLFLSTHGARGPDEWEFASPTWGTNPEIALAAIERLRHAPEERDPVAASHRLAAERDRVTNDVRGRLARPIRAMFDRLSRAARLYSEGRERAKAVFIDDTYPVRRALFELADRTSRRGGPGERRDFFLVTVDELYDFVVDPTSFESLIDERRRQRDELQRRQPPFVFEYEIPDPATWPLPRRRRPL